MTHVQRVKKAVAKMNRVFTLGDVTVEVNTNLEPLGTPDRDGALTGAQVSKAVRSLPYVRIIKPGVYRIKGRAVR